MLLLREGPRDHNNTMNTTTDTIRLCGCGCGGELVKPTSTSIPRFLRQKYLKGHHFRDPKLAKSQAERTRAAHARGAFEECCSARRERTLKARPLCKCGCGKPVPTNVAVYARGCFDNFNTMTPEKRAKALASRDMEKLKAVNSVRLTALQQEWKDSGKLDEIRRKAGNAKGMPDHLNALSWILRDPCGVTHRFSNLAEWARQNEHRFVDEYPEAKSPHSIRIAKGLAALLQTNGRTCSYKGWTAVSKLELADGGHDLLQRTTHGQIRENDARGALDADG